MYVPDTLNRLNDEAVKRERKEKRSCDHCDKKAVYHIPVYNPADAVRRPPVEGAYCIEHLCKQCYEDGGWMEELFTCPDCCNYFVTHHSWDSLACSVDGELYCQKCALDHLEPMEWSLIKGMLFEGVTSNFIRHNGFPDREPVWDGEFAPYNDFPGHQSFESVVRSVEESGIMDDDQVYAFVTATYQFSVVLGIWRA